MAEWPLGVLLILVVVEIVTVGSLVSRLRASHGQGTRGPIVRDVGLRLLSSAAGCGAA